MNPVIPITPEKSCNGCTACCSGALHGNAHGHHFWKGRPCHFVDTQGCTIYEQRPEVPCKSYLCGYLKFDWMPHWMRPDVSGVIVSSRETPKLKIPYLEVIEYRGKMQAEVLSFMFMSYVNKRFSSFTYQIDGGWNRVGEAAFLAEFD